MRIKIFLSYDGTAYYGWQRQKNAAETIQAHLERALSKVCASPIHCTSSGRTDAGVHARIQVVHADVPTSRLSLLENGRFFLAVNSLIPKDIRVHKISAADLQFHAQKDVLRKTYLYCIDTSEVQAPSLRNYAWHLRLPLDWDAINEGVSRLVGTHDFKAFCDADSSVKTTVRTIFEAQVGEVTGYPFGPSKLKVIRITGNGFLKHMVRSIVGTAVKVGEGKTDPDVFTRALRTKNRKLVGPTCPSHGLWLWDILYLT